VIVLVTNDDGIDSPGLDAIATALENDGNEVWRVAPDGERSGTSHSLSLRDPIRCRQVGERSYTASGSPADCVIVGLLGGIPVKPEIVVSGINIGPNLGTDIIYSGTAAAARQATIMGVPGIAVSIHGYRPPFFFGPLCSFVVEHLSSFVSLWDPDHFININGPNSDRDVGTARVTVPARRYYDDMLESIQSPSGDFWYFLAGKVAKTELEEGSDWHAVDAGFISLSPVEVTPTGTVHHADYRRLFAQPKENASR
jgi:5'-nucleotidase